MNSLTDMIGAIGQMIWPAFHVWFPFCCLPQKEHLTVVLFALHGYLRPGVTSCNACEVCACVDSLADFSFVLHRFFSGRAVRGCMVLMALSTTMLILFAFTASWGTTTNSVFMLLAGAFNCGPDSMLGKCCQC